MYKIPNCLMIYYNILDRKELKIVSYISQVGVRRILTVQKHIIFVMDLLLALNIITYIHY